MNAACILQYKAYSATLKEIWLPGDGIKVYAVEVRAIMSIENLVPTEQFLVPFFTASYQICRNRSLCKDVFLYSREIRVEEEELA